VSPLTAKKYLSASDVFFMKISTLYFEGAAWFLCNIIVTSIPSSVWWSQDFFGTLDKLVAPASKMVAPVAVPIVGY
jgi:hypothetical protein